VLVLLVLWDIDGTLVDSAGHGRFAFENAFREVVGRDPERVDYAGRTDHQIALAMLNGSHEELPDVLEGLVANLAERRDAIAAEGHIYPGVRETLSALHKRDDVVQSLLTGNVEPNAAIKVGAFGLERWLDLEAGAYGSDPHERRSDLVAVARERAAARLAQAPGAAGRAAPGAAGRAATASGEPTGAVLVGDTPLDVVAAREAGARAVAVATGFADLDALRASEPDVLLQDLSDTEAAIRAITAST
jgi:phosphoglycolate phosphatase-like HAD superfamily hydrolase